jgi:hypothetical protein
MWPLFLLAMIGGLCGLSLISWREVPLTVGTAAFILTLAALGLAILH